MSRLFASTVAIPILIAAIPAVAADFTINVPVTIENMPAARQFQVYCSTYDTAEGGGSPVNIVGQGTSARIDIPDGRYSGPPVAIEFNSSETRGPSEARSYGCYISIFGVRPDGRSFEAAYFALITSWQAITGQTVTLSPDGSLVKGAIPR